MAILSFTDALAASNKGARHLLLGNGFSRAICDSVFNYSALFARAQVKLTSTAAQSFKALATTNFEEVMRALKSATALASIYAASMPSAAAAMQKDLDAIRDLLAETIAESHPNRPHAITPEQYSSCKQFLEPFGNIYTCNYDLLLYWTVMQNEVEPHVRSDDGFRHPDDPADYVVWEVQNTNSQNIHYLHGALHIYDAGHEIKKYTWVRTDVPLIEQIRTSLHANMYPLFVSEGTWQEKLARIQHSSYLGRAYRSFANITGSLFIFGLSLAENDEHILTLMDDNKVEDVYLGVFDDPAKPWNVHMIARAKTLGTKRKSKRPLRLHLYDAASARVWDK